MEDAFLIKTLMGILIAAITGMGKRIWDMSKDLGHKASYEWAEKTLKPEIEKDIKSCKDDVDRSIKDMDENFTLRMSIMNDKHQEIMKAIQDIREAIIGSIDRPGLRTLISEVDARVKHLERDLGDD